MSADSLFASSSVVWPLVFLLIALLALKQVRDDIRPIFIGIVTGLKEKAQSNAMAWAVMLLVALLGSMQAMIEVAQENHWKIMESLAKIATPFFAGLVAGTRQSPIGSSTSVSPVPEKPLSTDKQNT